MASNRTTSAPAATAEHRSRHDRREFARRVAAASAAVLAEGAEALAAPAAPFALNYIVASSMYGKTDLAEIVPEVPRAGARFIEIWSEPHGNQREQIDRLGADAFVELLRKHGVRLGSFTCFKTGIFAMQAEMRLVRRLGGDMVICNSGGPGKLAGAERKAAVAALAEKLKPHVAAAAEAGVTIGVENHSGSLINSADSQRWLLDQIDSAHLGIALAPYHLPQDAEQIAGLIENLGKRLVHFQAWQHGMGCMRKLPKDQELLQLPGRGELDFVPILAALKKIGYAGRTEIFMHPVPRGIPILPTTAAVTAAMNESRQYLEACLQQV